MQVSRGRAFQTEDTASVKALRLEGSRCDAARQGRGEPPGAARRGGKGVADPVGTLALS
jgi:hypothetical protein